MISPSLAKIVRGCYCYGRLPFEIEDEVKNMGIIEKRVNRKELAGSCLLSL